MNSHPVIVMYSPDSIGLGHIRRHTAIASRVLHLCPQASVVLLVGSGVGAFFELPKGVDSVKLPSVQKTGRNSWTPRSLHLSSHSAGQLRAGLIRETIQVLKPDALLVDHTPTGIWDELLPSLEMIKQRGMPTRVVLGLRDILDEPSRIRSKWSDEGTFDLINRYYDDVFVYGTPKIFAAADAYALPRSKVRYCGYVSEAARTHGIVGAECPLDPGKRNIVVSAGGGHDAYPMMSACLSAMAAMPEAQEFTMTVITGPLMAESERDALRKQSEGIPVEIIAWTTQLGDYLAAADLNVTMGGYNSALEAASAGKPLVIIPRDGPSAEQAMRAAMFDKLGLATSVRLAEAEPRALYKAFMSAIERHRPALSGFELNGAEIAATNLLRRLAAERPRSPGLRSVPAEPMPAAYGGR